MNDITALTTLHSALTALAEYAANHTDIHDAIVAQNAELIDITYTTRTTFRFYNNLLIISTEGKQFVGAAIPMSVAIDIVDKEGRPAQDATIRSNIEAAITKNENTQRVVLIAQKSAQEWDDMSTLITATRDLAYMKIGAVDGDTRTMLSQRWPNLFGCIGPF